MTAAERTAGALPAGWRPPRAVATAGVALVTVSFLSVLYSVANITGTATPLLALVVVSLLAATLLARFLSPLPALVLTSGLLAVGAFVYLQTLPGGIETLQQRLPRVARDTVVLLSGLSVLRIVNAGTWSLAATPAPVFLTWYFALRRRYVAAVSVGGLALTTFVLTGDASLDIALLGAVGAAVAVGFGDIERRGGTLATGDILAVVLAAMVVLTLSVSVVPGAAGESDSAGGWISEGDTGSMESSLVETGDSVAVLGSIKLSPKVRFTVRSEKGGYWRVASYDRYTGQGWIRTGGEQPYDGELAEPQGPTQTVTQQVRAKTTLGVMPARWKAERVVDSDVDVLVSPDGDLLPADHLSSGDTYRVVSQVPTSSSSELRQAGTDYPAAVRNRYLQVPASTPDRVGDRTARITANADNPYDTARVIERWLQNNYRYSLDVQRPEGDIADAFLFEMEAGYCTYFATTMVTMLRTQGIPARFVVGYTPGQQVSDERWVVRGLDSHAWVEVYFPEHGWVRFDPTPADPREQTEQSRLDTARTNGASGVDTNGSNQTDPTPTPTPPPTNSTVVGSPPGNTTTDPPGATPPPGVDGGTAPPSGPPGGDGGPSLPDLPSNERLVLGAVALFGLAVGVRRSGLVERGRREVWLRRQPRADPQTDVERAYRRLVYLRERQGWPRDPGDTPRQFLADADARVGRVGRLYEQARYAGRVTESDAAEAVELVDQLVREHTRLPFP